MSHGLPPLPHPAALDGLLTPDELDATTGRDADPRAWFCAAGRLVRGWTVDGDTSRQARDACALVHSPDSAGVLLAQIEALLEALGDIATILFDEGDAAASDADGDEPLAWIALAIRDDLESILAALGLVVLGTRDDATGDAFEAVERYARSAFLASDTYWRKRADALSVRLRGEEPGEHRQRLATVSRDASAGWWIALAESASLSRLPKALLPKRPPSRIPAPESEEPFLRLPAEALNHAGLPGAAPDAAQVVAAAVATGPIVELGDDAAIYYAAPDELIPADERPSPVGLVVVARQGTIDAVEIRGADGETFHRGTQASSARWWVDLAPLAPPERRLFVRVNGREHTVRIQFAGGA